MPKPSYIDAQHRQQGATLIVALIILVLITVIGLSTTNVTSTDIKIVANSKDRQLAFIAAETELQDAGETIHINDPSDIEEIDAYVGDDFSSSPQWWKDHENWNIEASNSSEYLIQKPIMFRPNPDNNVMTLNIGNIPPDFRFKSFPVTAKAFGPGNSFVVLQSHYRKKADLN